MTVGGLFSLLNPQPWADQALCAEVDPDLWFPEKGGRVEEAKLICAACPVQAECLLWALEHDEPVGVWGGHSARERSALKRGRPLRVTLEERAARAQARRAQPRPCGWCGEPFTGQTNAVYCSEQCRTLRDRHQQKLKRRAA